VDADVVVFVVGVDDGEDFVVVWCVPVVELGVLLE